LSLFVTIELPIDSFRSWATKFILMKYTQAMLQGLIISGAMIQSAKT
jgi:hypothetical protein